MQSRSRQGESGENGATALAARPAPAPALAVIAAAPAPDASTQPARGESYTVRLARLLAGFFDRPIAAASRVSTAPVLDVRDFAWTATLRDQWRAIREEAIAVALQSRPGTSPDRRALAPDSRWRSFFLWGYGHRIDAHCARCPETSRLVEQIPGLNSACFAVLAPGTHVPVHRGVTKGLITCHLGLIVPRDGDVRMRIDRRTVRWAEGETLLFDDSYPHELWNDSSHHRVVLVVQFRRPLRAPGRWLADGLLRLLQRSARILARTRSVRRWKSIED